MPGFLTKSGHVCQIPATSDDFGWNFSAFCWVRLSSDTIMGSETCSTNDLATCFVLFRGLRNVVWIFHTQFRVAVFSRVQCHLFFCLVRYLRLLVHLCWRYIEGSSILEIEITHEGKNYPSSADLGKFRFWSLSPELSCVVSFFVRCMHTFFCCVVIQWRSYFLVLGIGSVSSPQENDNSM